jgi:hypothetical protein
MDARLQAAKAIIDFEARRDSRGHLVIYALPANDGGGKFEVAGINQKYNPDECARLIELIHAKKFDEAEAYAEEVIARDTDGAETWHALAIRYGEDGETLGDPGVQFFLRDCIFNRGLHGAARILQQAVRVHDDGIVGPITCKAAEAFQPAALLMALRTAREGYERNVVGYRANFWKGLVNRWNNALKVAQKFDSGDTRLA